jgi:hypothetical protein
MKKGNATKRVAWRTVAAGIESIVSAYTRAEAKAITLRSAHEVGYLVKYTEVLAGRAPMHDAWAEVDETRHPWGEQYLPASTAPAQAS